MIFVTRRIPEAGLAVLRIARIPFRIGQMDDEQELDHGALLEGVRTADVLLSLLTEPVDAEVLTTNPRLLGVANCAVGYDNVDVAAATELGIPVTNTPGVLTDTTADLTWALLLGLARRIPEAHAYMTAGRYRIWGPNLLLGGDVSPGGSGRRKVLGIIGFGRIGQAVARRALGFDMQVLAHDPYARAAIAATPHVSWSDLDALLTSSDFVSIHALLTDQTYHLIGEAQLRAMKAAAILINVARGPIVDEAALVQALRNGWIGGAALDVYENEPAMAAGLADCPNALLVPHIGSASRDTRDRMAAMAATNAVAHLRREQAPNVVNPEVYETAAYRRRTVANGTP